MGITVPKRTASFRSLAESGDDCTASAKLGMTNSLLWKMAIERVSFLIETADLNNSYVSHYQRVCVFFSNQNRAELLG